MAIKDKISEIPKAEKKAAETGKDQMIPVQFRMKESEVNKLYEHFADEGIAEKSTGIRKIIREYMKRKNLI